MAYILNCGAATPVGRNCAVSVASARAGIARLTKHPIFTDRKREPLIVGMAQYIDENSDPDDRFRRLTAMSLKEALDDIKPHLSNNRQIPLFMALPEQRPGLPGNLQALVADTIDQLSNSTGIGFSIECIAGGHAAGLEALKQGKEISEQQNAPLVVVGGVDCYFELETMEWLETTKRLFCSYYNDGFIPGEAAAFCVLTSEKSFVQSAEIPEIEIKSVGIGEEPRPHGSESTTLGEGLSKAIAEALQALEENRNVDQIFYGLNGESFHALELGYAMSRHGKRMNDIQNFVNWSRSWGDLGAASALISVCTIFEASKKNYLKGPLNMVLASSLGKSRAAAIFETGL